MVSCNFSQNFFYLTTVRFKQILKCNDTHQYYIIIMVKTKVHIEVVVIKWFGHVENNTNNTTLFEE